LISWQCKKQTIVATSSTEAEYVAAASCCAQVLWIQNQLLDYGFNFMNTKIFIDNQSTICIVKNPVFHQRTKHIEIRHHFIRDANEKNLIQVLKIHTNDNVADLLTKAFDGPRFEYLVVHIGMVVNTAARCTFFLLTGLVSAGRTMILLVVILSAERLDSAGSHHESGVSPFADSADSSSPPNVSTDHIPLDVLFESTSGGINDFFLDSDEDEQIGMSRVAADPDSDDDVLAEIIFRGKFISGDGVVLVDKLPDDEIVDLRVKIETVTESAASPPRSRRKHRGVRSDDFLWDKPVEDFFSSESESDDDMEHYIPPLPYGGFKDWEIVSCPLRNISYYVYHEENRRRKCFTYLKELLPHVYREDLLLLRRRMNRYFRLNPDVDVGLDLWRDVNLLCQSLHSDDVDEWIVSSWKLYPKSSVHVLDLTNRKTVYMFVDRVYPIRATLLERMLRHRCVVPPP
ncbi:hypothetical protein Tco_1062486, partial [Tanacetum coccineum]